MYPLCEGTVLDTPIPRILLALAGRLGGSGGVNDCTARMGGGLGSGEFLPVKEELANELLHCL